MTENEKAVLRTLVNFRTFQGRGATVGELSKRVSLGKSTVRRHLINLSNWGFASCDWDDYKSTGKRVFNPSEEGRLELWELGG